MKIRRKYRKIARSRAHTATVPFSANPAQILDALHDEARRRGVRIVRRPGSGTSAVALRRTIYVPRDWPARPIKERVALLGHEMVHVRQWATYGIGGFLARYARPSWRWALEVQAYAEGLRLRAIMRVPRRLREIAAKRTADRLWRRYALWPLSKKDARTRAMEVFDAYTNR